MELSGKVVLVTGASRGIGRATARALIARGAIVAVAARDTAALEALRAASVHAVDLADPANAAALADDVVAAHGRVDVLVNNAGLREDALITHVELEALDRAFQVNVLSPYVLAGTLAPAMIERGEGVIANLVAPIVAPGRRGMGAYAASKAALASMTNTLRQEVGAKGVAVFGFDPGWVRTDLAPDGKEEPDVAAARLIGHLEAAKGSREPLT